VASGRRRRASHPSAADQVDAGGAVARQYHHVNTDRAAATTSSAAITSSTIEPTLWPWSNDRVAGVDVVVGSEGGPLGSSSLVVEVVGGNVAPERRTTVVDVVVRSTVLDVAWTDVDVVGSSTVVDEDGPGRSVNVLDGRGSVVVVVDDVPSCAPAGNIVARPTASATPATTSSSRRWCTQAR